MPIYWCFSGNWYSTSLPTWMHRDQSLARPDGARDLCSVCAWLFTWGNMYINTHKHKYNIIIHNLNMTLEKIKPQTIILPRGGGMVKGRKKEWCEGGYTCCACWWYCYYWKRWPKKVKKLKIYLGTEFETKDLGELKYFLEIEVARFKKRITISQHKYNPNLHKEIGS